MSFNPKKIEFPSNKIIETKEAIKSKANFLLKEKIRYFTLFVRGIIYSNIQNIDTELSDDGLASYIKYLNDKKIYLEQIREKIQEKFNNKMDNVSSENDMEKIFKKADKKNEKYNDKINLIDGKLEEAQALKDAKEAAEKMDLDDESLPFDNKEEIPVEQLVEQPENNEEIEIQNIDVPMADQSEPNVEIPMINSEEEIPVEKLVEQTEAEKEAKLHEWAYGEPKRIDAEEKSKEIEKENPNSEINTQNEEIEESENIETKQEEKTPVELMYEEYTEKIENIKNACKENIDKQFDELLTKFKIEADELIKMQLHEITNTAKVSINEANSNLERTRKEKTEVEKERDQYKSHYEQTLDVVSKKEQIIESKDNEISSLNSTIDSKNNELNAASEREAELNTKIEKLKEVIAAHEEEIAHKDITIATIMAAKYDEAIRTKSKNEEQEKNIDLSQPIIEQTEAEKEAKLNAWVNGESKIMDSEEETTKTR